MRFKLEADCELEAANGAEVARQLSDHFAKIAEAFDGEKIESVEPSPIVSGYLDLRRTFDARGPIVPADLDH